MSATAFTVEFDPGQLADLKKALAPDDYLKVLDVAGTDLVHLAEGFAKELTPVVSGHARRETRSDAKPRDKVVEAHYPYFHWLDVGEDSRGRKMKVRDGGYRISEGTKQRAEADAERVLDHAGREILERWAA